MGIETMNRVWSNSRHSGSHLLMLVAISDHVNEKTGTWYLSLSTLAKKCRCSRRQAIRLVKELEASGELAIDCNAGKNGSNAYRVLCHKPDDSKSPLVTSMTSPGDADVTTPGDAEVTGLVTSMSPIPTMTTLRPTEDPQEGRRSAAMTVNDLVQRGLTSDVAERLLEWHRLKGKRCITFAEFDAFAAEVAKAPGYVVNEVAESISVGEYCAYLPNFSATHLPPHRSTLYAAPKWLIDATSEQRQALVRRDEIERYDDAAPFSLGARAQALGAMRRAGFDPLLCLDGLSDPFVATDRALDFQVQQVTEPDEATVGSRKC